MDGLAITQLARLQTLNLALRCHSMAPGFGAEIASTYCAFAQSVGQKKD